MSKKPVNFIAAMQTFEEREGVQRRTKPMLVPSDAPAAAVVSAQVTAPARQVQRSRIGKVSMGIWVDPAVRKQIAQLALDNDVDQADLIAESLNLLFERYGKAPIARS